MNIRMLTFKELVDTLGKDDLGGNIVPDKNWNIAVPPYRLPHTCDVYPDALQDNAVAHNGVGGNPWRTDDILLHTYNGIGLVTKDTYVGHPKSWTLVQHGRNMLMACFRPVFEYIDNEKSTSLYY